MACAKANCTICRDSSLDGPKDGYELGYERGQHDGYVAGYLDALNLLSPLPKYKLEIDNHWRNPLQLPKPVNRWRLKCACIGHTCYSTVD